MIISVGYVFGVIVCVMLGKSNCDAFVDTLWVFNVSVSGFCGRVTVVDVTGLLWIF